MIEIYFIMDKEVLKYIDLIEVLEEQSDEDFFSWYENEFMKGGREADEELKEYLSERIMRRFFK